MAPGLAVLRGPQLSDLSGIEVKALQLPSCFILYRMSCVSGLFFVSKATAVLVQVFLGSSMSLIERKSSQTTVKKVLPSDGQDAGQFIKLLCESLLIVDIHECGHLGQHSALKCLFHNAICHSTTEL